MSEDVVAAEWWGRRRLKYNMGLIVAGVLAFVCYVVVFELKIVPKDSKTEITLFTTAFQGLGYLVMVGIANACYSLGSLVERLVRPTNPLRFRKISYTLHPRSMVFVEAMPGPLLFRLMSGAPEASALRKRRVPLSPAEGPQGKC